jgi:2,4-diaminopentanoate dehydrogenase
VTYRVIQWATGRIGSHAVEGIVGHRDLELVGAWVHSPDKAGQDVGEIAGIGPVGVIATNDVDAVLGLDADCVCYTATEEEGEAATFANLTRILRSGKNVVNVTKPKLLYPQVADGVPHEDLAKAAAEGGVSLYTAGIDPGDATASAALNLLGMARHVDQVRMYEIMNYASWVSPYNYMETVYGFGQPDPAKCVILTAEYTGGIWGPTVTLVAEAMGLEVDEVVVDHELIYADEAFDIASMHIPKDTIAGMRFEIKAMVDGAARVVVEHVTRLRDEDFPEVAFPGRGYRIRIDGDPCLVQDLTISSPTGDEVHAAYISTAMPLVNAIPGVCDAPPGLLTLLDLRPHPSRNT